MSPHLEAISKPPGNARKPKVLQGNPRSPIARELAYVVLGTPISWKRAEDRSRASKQFWSKRKRTDPLVKAAMEAHQWHAMEARPRGWLREGVFELEVRSYYATGKSHGDWDNLGKHISDALQGIAFDNDRQIARAISDRFVDTENPRVEVYVRRIERKLALTPDELRERAIAYQAKRRAANRESLAARRASNGGER